MSAANLGAAPAPAPPGGDDARVEFRSCGHWKRHHDGNGCNVVAGTADSLGDAPCPCARFVALPGGDDGAAAGDLPASMLRQPGFATDDDLDEYAYVEFVDYVAPLIPTGERIVYHAILPERLAEIESARDAALSEAARARAEVERLRPVSAAYLNVCRQLDEAEAESARLAAALGRVQAETRREVDAPIGTDFGHRVGWADGYTAACDTIRAATAGTDETGGDDQ